LNILIGAANGGIAKALGAELYSRGHQVSSLSRGLAPEWSVAHLKTDLSKDTAVDEIKQWVEGLDSKPGAVIQCAGILHGEDQMPEKTLMQISEKWLHENLSANLMTHVRLAQALNFLVSRRQPIQWVSLSAMVGSITDNQLGGWHSYRMSKAALNMFVRNLHIEWTRKSPESTVVALHPGTTDTNLSEPFQANINNGKLYSVNTTAERLADVIEKLSPEQSGTLLNWDGSALPF
jgi:NAD(P)-dependent dehydrogenase (short-subunit alcohol dehydrogenase family)